MIGKKKYFTCYSYHQVSALILYSESYSELGLEFYFSIYNHSLFFLSFFSVPNTPIKNTLFSVLIFFYLLQLFVSSFIHSLGFFSKPKTFRRRSSHDTHHAKSTTNPSKPKQPNFHQLSALFWVSRQQVQQRTSQGGHHSESATSPRKPKHPSFHRLNAFLCVSHQTQRQQVQRWTRRRGFNSTDAVWWIMVFFQ